MPMIHRKDLFEFMLKQIKQTAGVHGDRLPQAFGRWFSRMYFPGITSIVVPDAAGDGKVDLLIECQVGKEIRYKILNTKYTSDYDRASPVSFYDEITRYWQAFENKTNRTAYLKTVRQDLHRHFKRLFKLYDEGDAELYFVTNHRINEKQCESVKDYGVKTLHLEELLQYVAEHIEGAMPETEPLLLTGISNVLTPATNESEVPTSIIFARLIDFIDYMERDPFDLLFARNVRLDLGDTEPNKAIEETFRDAPKEFAYSNNGITVLCKRHTHNPGKQELLLQNPRVVNGSQTLHSVRKVDEPSRLARVMVRVIEVPPVDGDNLPRHIEKKKDIIHKISIRSNLQNPIRRWNLVSNDDFQNELARYFWDKRLYYERRQREWALRKLELQGVGMRRGPDIRWMTQLIAAYHYDRPGLGPAIAQGSLNSLFNERPYTLIRSTRSAMAYQLYLLGAILDHATRKLAAKKRYIRNIRGYSDLPTFALIVRALRQAGVQFGREELNKILETAHESDKRIWEVSAKCAIDHFVDDFKMASRRIFRQTAKELTPANYVKNAALIKGLLDRPLPRELRALAAEFRG